MSKIPPELGKRLKAFDMLCRYVRTKIKQGYPTQIDATIETDFDPFAEQVQAKFHINSVRTKRWDKTVSVNRSEERGG